MNGKNIRMTWKHGGAVAACLVFIVTAYVCGLLKLPNAPKVTPSDKLPGVIVPVNKKDQETSLVPFFIDMHKIYVNELQSIEDAASLFGDPAQSNQVIWKDQDISNYYGRELTPAYIPDSLKASDSNGTHSAIISKDGKVLEDTVYLSFYHSYYEDGSPQITENVNAAKGFTLAVSKIGWLNSCIYILPENQVQASKIGGTSVTIGYRSMPYGPYRENKEPAGYYDFYVAEFELEGIQYQITAEQISLEEVTKVVASIIYNRADLEIIQNEKKPLPII